jgi:hypothetical protein
VKRRGFPTKYRRCVRLTVGQTANPRVPNNLQLLQPMRRSAAKRTGNLNTGRSIEYEALRRVSNSGATRCTRWCRPRSREIQSPSNSAPVSTLAVRRPQPSQRERHDDLPPVLGKLSQQRHQPLTALLTAHVFWPRKARPRPAMRCQETAASPCPCQPISRIRPRAYTLESPSDRRNISSMRGPAPRRPPKSKPATASCPHARSE